jgi:MFS family permease
MTAPSDSLAPTPLSRRVNRAIWGLGLTQIIGYGTTYYLLGLMGTLIMRDLGLSKSVMLAGVSLTLLTSGLAGPIVGRFQDHQGSRLVMAIGSVLMGAGLAVIAVADGTLSYFAGWIIIAAGSPLTLYNAAFTSLARMSGRNARRAILLVTLIGGLASSIVWPLSAIALSVLDWRSLVMIFAAMNILLCAPLHALLLDGRERLLDGAPLPEPVPPGLAPSAHGLAFLLLTTMLACVSLVGNGWSMLAFPVLEGIGFGYSETVLIASLVGVFQVLGRIGEMATASRHTALRTAQVSNVLFALSFVILALAKGALLGGLIFAAAYGIANGLNTIVKGTLTLQLFGSQGYGEKLGKVTLFPSVAATCAPVLGGLIIDYKGADGLVGAFMILGLVAVSLMILLSRHCNRHATDG